MMIDNEHKEIDGVSFTLIPIIPFEEWVEKRHSGMEKFKTLSRRDKEKVFLRWKWGFDDARANEGLELSEKQILYQFKEGNLSAENPAIRFHIECKLNFDRVCYETKKRIGLIFKSNPLVNKLVDTFNATEET